MTNITAEINIVVWYKKLLMCKAYFLLLQYILLLITSYYLGEI